jgi:two-component system sensor histidine kinase/response regulator
MRRDGSRKLITVVFGMALGILALIGVVSYRTMMEFFRSVAERHQNHLIIEKAELLLSEVKDFETGQRGYLLTGREDYARPYEVALAKVDQTFKDLESLTEDDPESRRTLHQLADLIGAKLADIQRTVELRQLRGLNAALKVVMTHEGKRSMDAIRNVITAMESRQQALLKVHEADMEASARNSVRIILAGTTLSLTLLLSAFYLLRREIAVRGRAEEALIEERKLLGVLMDNLPDYIYFKDCDSRVIRTNVAHAHAFGLRHPEQAVGKTDFDFFDPEHARQAFADEQEIMRTGLPLLDKEEKETWPDGRVSWVSTTKMPLRDSRHNIIGTFGVSRNITERRRAEMENLRLKTAIEQATEAIVITDPTGLIQYVNPAFTVITGYTSEDVLKQNPRLLKSGAQGHAFYEYLWKTITSGQTWQGEIINRRKDGSIYPEWMTISPVLDSAGSVVNYIAIKHDNTQRSRAEVDLREAKAAAEAATQAKSSFLANMSHEIRTPMNGIIGMTELALETDLSSEQREYMSIVKTSADLLMTLINDILDFSKIEAGKLDLDLIEFNLHDSIGDTIKTLALKASDKGIELISEIQPDVPAMLVGDPARLRQVLVNLLGNALKFTDKGEVVLSAKMESEDTEAATLQFTVQDTGIGIPVDRQKSVFEAFTQADSSTTRKYGGTGLGLTITSRLVELLGGRIWLESEPGRGSAFHFTARFGLGKLPVAHVRPPEFAALRGLRVLVVDDNATNRRMLEQILTLWHMAPTLADGGTAGLAVLRQAKEAEKPFALVLTDVHMPEMDGFTFVEHIQCDTQFKGITIMMLTSAGQRGDAARCRRLGVTSYLTKPIKQSELREGILTALASLGDLKTQAPLVTRHSMREGHRILRILLAEDNSVNQTLAIRLLEKQGHTVVVANNGMETLAALHDPSDRRFDLILMDVQMPDMDGFEATAVIRETEKLTGKHLPIIAMTAHAMKGDRERCLAAGMDGYVAKPIHPDELIREIQSMVEAPRTAPPEPATPASGGILRKEVILDRVGGDIDLLRGVVDIFLEDCPRMMADVQEAIAAKSTKALQDAAHSLKGAIGNFTSEGAFQAALRLEVMGQGGDLAHVEELHTALKMEMATLSMALEEMKKELASPVKSWHFYHSDLIGT